MNGLAIWSFVLGLLWIFWLGSALGLVFGIVAIRQVKRSQGTQRGTGLAIAGIVLSALWLLLLILGIIGSIAGTNHNS
jgi:uncharacterized membrane protein